MKTVLRGSVAGLLDYGRTKLGRASSGLLGRSIHGGKFDGSTVNPVAIQMIDYALSLAHSLKSEESYAEGMLILEQCLSSGSNMDEVDMRSVHNSKGMALLAMSNLLFDRGKYGDAMDRLQCVSRLAHASSGLRVSAMEALAGVNLLLGDDNASSLIADKSMELLENDCHNGSLDEVHVRATAVKGFVELARGNVSSAEAFFSQMNSEKVAAGSTALSYGEFLHSTNRLTEARKIYEKVIEDVAKTKDFSNINTLSACNMEPKDILLAASCSLGQLDSHIGNFDAAEETLTKALNGAEQTFGSRHPKIGVVLTCLALMFRSKAKTENSSSLLIQEGLYRRASELLKIPALGSEGEMGAATRNIAAIVRGGYAQILGIQEKRNAEAERMQKWADSAWNNGRLSLADVLDSTSKLPVIDTRICRAI